MRTPIDRSATARALAKAIAYADCDKRAEARMWAAELVRLLGQAGILDPNVTLPRPVLA